MRIFLGEVIDPSGSSVETLYPPVGLAYLAAYLERRHKDWEIKVDRGWASLEVSAHAFKPDIIGLSFVSKNAEKAVRSVQGLRKAFPTVPIVAGGHHVSAMPWWLEERTGAKVITIEGEGEKPFLALCEAAEKKDYRAMSEIPGIGYSELVFGENKEYAEEYQMVDRVVNDDPLDKLPMPAWDKFMFSGDEAQIFTSRGCPFSCTFCSSACFWGNARYHSPKRVVAEFRELYTKHGIRRFNIYDDLFAINKGRVRAIKNGLESDSVMRDGNYAFCCLARASMMDREMATMLYDMGCSNIAFGLESGNDRVLKSLKGTTARVKSNMKAVEFVKGTGMGVVGSVIYGVPGESYEDVLETVGMVKHMKKFFDLGGDAYLATPYPGTKMWEDAAARGIVSEDMDFSKLHFHTDREIDEDSVVISDKLGWGQLRDLRHMFIDAFS